MAYEHKTRRRKRPIVRRVWLYSLLLTLPALALALALLISHRTSLLTTFFVVAALLIYAALVTASLVELLTRPLQTLFNVISSLREGDYSFRARGAGSPDAFGELAGEVNALADILQRQRVRSLEATALLARILEVMNAPLFAFDREEVLQLANAAGAQLLGRPLARCLGRTAEEVGLVSLLTAPDESLHSFGARPARWLLRKASFRQEGIPHTLLLLADVSQPLREEEQAAWKRLIRVLGHELSNSLAPIKSIAGSLLDRAGLIETGDLARDFQRGLGVIEGRAESLHRFVQSYRVLAQLPPPRLKPVQIPELLERISPLERRVPVSLGSGPPATVNADPDQLEQMLINLLANAADASLENGRKPVRIFWQVSESNVLVTIEDSGPGIANSENLFVPFYTTKSKGSGVGLALAQQIARAHGGEIQLTNREGGEGAQAIVRLPLE
ncbi:MAG TPA: ATP-binding protein [Terracidiphilus sp.]|nr:ATP-binding protein [Terracidiphilus sp.]